MKQTLCAIVALASLCLCLLVNSSAEAQILPQPVLTAGVTDTCSDLVTTGHASVSWADPRIGPVHLLAVLSLRYCFASFFSTRDDDMTPPVEMVMQVRHFYTSAGYAPLMARASIEGLVNEGAPPSPMTIYWQWHVHVEMTDAIGTMVLDRYTLWDWAGY